MSYQFLVDNNGVKQAIIIPIKKWEEIIAQIGEDPIKHEETAYPVNEWQKSEVRERLEDYRKNPAFAKDTETVLNQIERDL